MLISNKNNEVSEIDAVLSEKVYEDQDHASVIKNFGLSMFDRALLTFDGIKSNLPPQTLWLYLQEKHSIFLSSKNAAASSELEKVTNEMQESGLTLNDILSTFDRIKLGLAPGILWSYLREKHPEFLLDAIKDHLFPLE